ncbi:MAG: diaminopimelate epimerase [Deltaproteobacteria bacterium]|nr:diaminopimelate epimerase [Deltaproteobacteria bacterium]
MKQAKKIQFTKMSGSGNDFIFMDGMDGSYSWVDSMWVRQICQRALSVGADGVVVLEKDDTYDFAWRFFNSDGTIAEMCGNASRCAARFAYKKGIAGSNMTFATLAGPIRAEVKGKRVKVQLTDPRLFDPEMRLAVDGQTFTLFYIDTGVPHVVLEVEDLEGFPLIEIGRKIRFHEKFGPAGTNVNVAQITGDNAIALRTYERGVENETLACGTGSVAASLMMSMKKGFSSPVSVRAASGEILTISWEGEVGTWAPVFFEGEVRFIYEGWLHPEAIPEATGKKL